MSQSAILLNRLHIRYIGALLKIDVLLVLKESKLYLDNKMEYSTHLSGYTLFHTYKSEDKYENFFPLTQCDENEPQEQHIPIHTKPEIEIK